MKYVTPEEAAERAELPLEDLRALGVWRADKLPMEPAPGCPVCGEPLGRRVYLDVLDTKNGGTFRLSCDAEDEAHGHGIKRHYKIRGFQHAMEVLLHVGIKTWADPCQLLRTLWPWLRLSRWHDAG